MNETKKYPRKIEGKRPEPTPFPKKFFSVSVECPDCGAMIVIQDIGRIYGPVRTDHKINFFRF